MGLLDPKRVYAAELAAVCRPGESLRAVEHASYAPGVEDTGPEHLGVTFDPINGLDVPGANRSVEKAIGGVTLIGAPSSLGSRLAQSLGEAGHVVLTDRRLVVMTLDSTTSAVRLEAPIAEIADIAWDPRPLQHGRVRIVLRDSSLVRLLCGLMFPGAARRLASAWSESS